MYASPTFNALRESAEAIDFYNFGPAQGKTDDAMTQSPNQEFSLVEQRDELTLVKGDSAENFSGLGQHQHQFEQKEKGCNDSSLLNQKVRRELSFKDHSDIFSIKQQDDTTQQDKERSTGAVADSNFFNAARKRQESSITAQTQVSTQHSDDQ